MIAFSAAFSINQFNTLTNPEKLNYVVEQGRFIVNNSDKGFLIALYAVEQFFVKIWYDTRIDTIYQIEALGAHVTADASQKLASAREAAVDVTLN